MQEGIKKNTEQHEEFNKVIDATSTFLKSIFPHATAFFKAIKTKIEKSKDIK